MPKKTLQGLERYRWLSLAGSGWAWGSGADPTEDQEQRAGCARIPARTKLPAAINAGDTRSIKATRQRQPRPPGKPLSPPRSSLEGQPTLTLPPLSLDPKQFEGLPDVVAGYKVLAVRTSQNTLCWPSGNNVLVLQAANEEDLPASPSPVHCRALHLRRNRLR